MSKEEKTLLDLAIEYVEKVGEPKPIDEIVDNVLEQKNVKKADYEDLKAQLIMDFMLSGNFVFVKEGWDLKYRQKLEVLDKDPEIQEDSEVTKEVDENILNEENSFGKIEPIEDNERYDDNDSDEDEDNEEDSDFEELTGDVEELEDYDGEE